LQADRPRSQRGQAAHDGDDLADVAHRFSPVRVTGR
jgi:hypothetical protein